MANEKRLIDANWVLGEIEHDLGCYEIGKLEKADVLFVDLRDVVRMVCDAPTVDAVEVVRCKDCKYSKLDNVARHKTVDGETDDTTVYCCFYHWDYNVWNKGDHFCSHGERRADV
jgi:hypothetical protein